MVGDGSCVHIHQLSVVPASAVELAAIGINKFTLVTWQEGRRGSYSSKHQQTAANISKQQQRQKNQNLHSSWMYRDRGSGGGGREESTEMPSFRLPRAYLLGYVLHIQVYLAPLVEEVLREDERVAELVEGLRHERAEAVTNEQKHSPARSGRREPNSKQNVASKKEKQQKASSIKHRATAERRMEAEAKERMRSFKAEKNG